MPAHLLDPPAGLPIDLAALRLHCRRDTTDDDPLLGVYLSAAVEYAQNATGRQLIAARLRFTLDRFPCGPLRLPSGPVIQVEAVQYLDSAGAEQTLSSADYVVQTNCEPTRIAPAHGKIWPVTLAQPGAVWIDYWAGYAAPCTADVTADTLTVRGWPPLAEGAPVRLSNSGGSLPSPLVPGPYYVAEVVGDSVYKLTHTSGGDPINLTSTGTGTHYLGQPGPGHAGAVPAGLMSWLLLRVGSLDEHRAEQAIIRGGNLAPLPFVDRLLDPYRIPAV